MELGPNSSPYSVSDTVHALEAEVVISDHIDQKIEMHISAWRDVVTYKPCPWPVLSQPHMIASYSTESSRTTFKWTYERHMIKRILTLLACLVQWELLYRLFDMNIAG